MIGFKTDADSLVNTFRTYGTDMNIKVEMLTDSYECDTCGWSDAYGAKVYFDGELAIDMTPIAHCYSGKNYTDEDVFTAILQKLGHNVETV